ncbi:MAG TPA: ATP-binding protein [Thermoanaerobaculia bacterium]|nr:ATP-binding protein [Thermoanaerobaculia bacterium]
MTAYRPREITPLLREALGTLPVVVVTGLRQAGKTTLLATDPTFAGRRYLTLDDLATLEAAERDPDALIAGDEPVTVDEVQRSPGLLLAVKRAVDRRREPGRFLLSGSANLALLGGVSESLAGRALYLTLHPFTRRERLGRTAEPPFLVRFLAEPKLPVSSGAEAGAEPLSADEILAGGLPPVALGDVANRALWFLGYEQTYLERDLRALSQVADLVAFRNVMRLAALRTGQVLNQSELARDARVPVSTVSRYLGLLEVAFVIVRLAPHLRSRATRLLKSPKIFVSDSGLAAHLVGATDLSPEADEPMRGALLETYVYQNLAGILDAHMPQARLDYWSLQGRHEVDFVISQGSRAVAIEVKAAARIGDRDLAGLKALKAKTPGVRAGIVAYNGTEALRLGDDLYGIPLGRLLS